MLFCDECGKGLAIPRYAPRSQRSASSPTLTAKPQQPVIPFEATLRFTDQELESFLADQRQWPKWGDRWDDFEQSAMLRIKGNCTCGGNWRSPTEHEDAEQSRGVKPNWLTRCPQCRSKDFKYTLDADVLND